MKTNRSSFSTRTRLLLNGILFVLCLAPGVYTTGAEKTAIAGRLAPALKSQAAGLGREQCSIDPEFKGRPAGLREGDQVRVYTSSNGVALFTVRFNTEKAGDKNLIRMTAQGRKRIGLEKSHGQRIHLRTPVIRPGITEEEARQQNEFIELLEAEASPIPKTVHLLILAPHGGSIEPGTDIIGRRILAAPSLKHSAVLWACLGFRAGGGAYTRWHITSTDISEQSFPKLGKLAESGRTFLNAIAIHGHRGDAILIGGAGNTQIKDMLRKELNKQIPSVKIHILEKKDRLSGFSSRNIVNRYSKNGIQIELPMTVRKNKWKETADAIIAVFKKKP